jgi:uncharacterized protein YjbJ (UPF0337 family)
MNTNKVEGKFDQVAGKVKQGVGEAVGNQKLANAGAAEQIKGAAKETWGNAKDTAKVVRQDDRARATTGADDMKYRTENKAHDVRDKVTTTAQNMKNKVNEKLDDMKHKHRG